MVIVYDSRTNNVKRFVDKVKGENVFDVEVIKLTTDLIIGKPFHLITYTTKIGQAPDSTLEFLKNNSVHALSVSSSGNMNWGNSFALALDKISDLYPTVEKGIKFEMSGMKEDVKEYIKVLKKYNGS